MIETNNVSYYGGDKCFNEIHQLLGNEGTIMWCIGTVKKYLFRAGRKVDNPEEVDIEKASWYWNRATQIIDFLGDNCTYRTRFAYNKVREEMYKYV